MKKLLAIILALTLALSLGTVAFAASYTHNITVDYNGSGDLTILEDKTMITPSEFVPGTTFYIRLVNADSEYNGGSPLIKSTSAIKDYRLNYTINDGKKFVSSIKFVTKSDTGRSGNTTAWIAISTVGSNSSDTMDIDIDFTIYGKNDAKTNGTTNHEFNVNFTMENKVTEAGGYTTVNSNAPIVNFDGIDDSDPIELYFDNDVEFHVVARGQKELYLKYSDDPTGTKYDLDSKYSNADLEYHLWDGTNKTFRRTGKLYIPASSLSNGKAPYLYQISSAGALTQVKAKYDSSEEEFIIDTATLNNYIVSDIALSASGSSSDTSSSESSTPSETPKSETGNSANAAEIAAQVAQKIKTSKANGTAKPSVDLTVQNEESISAKDLQTIVTAAVNAGGTVRVVADTVSNGNTTGRLYVVPANAAAVKNDISYGVYTDSANTSATESMFEKWYNNNVSVIHLAQKTTYGLPVSIAAKVDLSDLNTKSLKFYSYSGGKYYAITSPAYWIDTAGYLHFNTTLAGDIVITDKPLTAK